MLVLNPSDEPVSSMIFDGDPTDEFKTKVNEGYALNAKYLTLYLYRTPRCCPCCAFMTRGGTRYACTLMKIGKHAPSGVTPRK